MILETLEEAAAFERRLATDPNATPFGIHIGEIPMGTLTEVAGAERSCMDISRLDKLTASQVQALQDLGLHSLARYVK